MDIPVNFCFCGQNDKNNQFMIQCDFCKDWFHGSCVNIKEYKVIEIDKYFCPQCSISCGPPILKSYSNWHRHEFWDTTADTKSVQTGTGVFIRELCSRHFASEGEIVTHMRGSQVTETFLQQNGFDTPIVIDEKDGLDMVLPPDTFSVSDVEFYVGSNREIDVIDVMRQTDFKMPLKEFVDYYNNPNKTRVYNVISLEFSNTSLSPLVEAPLVVRKLDWINNVWPKNIEEETISKPQVQKYCLMSVKDSYTDFHFDFGGTSVWYHVLSGEKVFYFIRPTSANLSLYQHWMAGSTHSETFFGDQVDQCFKVVLRKGQTMIIPTGWIHAVYTPVDSIVFGGNFLHSLNISMQLEIYDIEKKMKTVEKFKLPMFEKINWYAAKKLLTVLKEINTEEKKCPNNLLAGIKQLLQTLKQWNSDKDYQMLRRAQIPDVINSHKLLKDLTKEVRHAERFLISLNPPKPERESKRKRKRPVNKDFVDFSHPQKLYENSHDVMLPNEKSTNKKTNVTNTNTIPKLSIPKSSIPKSSIPKSSIPKSSIPKSSIPKSSITTTDSKVVVPPPPKISTTTINKTLESNDKNWTDHFANPNERWVVTNVNAGDKSDRPVLKFKLGNKPEVQPSIVNDNIYSLEHTQETQHVNYNFNDLDEKAKAIYGFHEDSNHFEDEFALKIDEKPVKRRRSTINKSKTATNKASETFSDLPKNGIESLLKASALTTKFINSGGASPSTQEAIAGMLSIGESYNQSFGISTIQKPPKRSKTSIRTHIEEPVNKVHQDDEYIYPSLDNSDEEDFQIFKPRGRSKMDETWNPKARVGPLLPKMNRPAREGTKKQAVEKVLEAAAAKRAAEPCIQDVQKRVYRKKKPKPQPPTVKTTTENNVSTPHPSHSLSHVSSHSTLNTPTSKHSKPKKGMKTAKQRLGKILKIHKMIH